MAVMVVCAETDGAMAANKAIARIILFINVRTAMSTSELLRHTTPSKSHRLPNLNGALIARSALNTSGFLTFLTLASESSGQRRLAFGSRTG